MASRYCRISIAPVLPAGVGGELCTVDLDAGRGPKAPVLRVWRAGPPAGLPGLRVTLLESPDGTSWKEIPGLPEPMDGGETLYESEAPGPGEAPEQDPTD